MSLSERKVVKRAFYESGTSTLENLSKRKAGIAEMRQWTKSMS